LIVRSFNGQAIKQSRNGSSAVLNCYNIRRMGVLRFFFSPSFVIVILDAVVLAACYRITLPVYLKFRRRKEGYGTVFDSFTGAPVDLARIRLIDVHGLTAATAVTDKSGHYRLVVAPGEYIIDVARTGYKFPSKFLEGGLERSATYDNVIPSRRVRIKDHGIVTKNIPIDPESASCKRSKVFRRRLNLSEDAQLLTTWLSPFLAVAIPLMSPAETPSLVVMWILGAAYSAAIAARFLSFKPGRGAYGTVRDALTGLPLDRVIIRLFEGGYDRHLQTITTTDKGRYAFLVNAGSYYVLLKKEGFKTVRLNFPNITKDSYPLATDIKMKRLAAEAE
jgi:hypothetical protein